MAKDNKILLQNILTSIDKILLFTKDFNQDTFLQNELVKDAVVRNFEIIGEASKVITSDFKDLHSDIPWKKMAGMRDKLIHDYEGVDYWAVWNIILDILPDLRTKIQFIISSLH
jgi:uncharacterized protein with HEPN domain